MVTPMVAGRTADLVAREARINAYCVGGTSYPTAHDPRHERAYRGVEHGAEDWSEVRTDAPYPAPLSFRAWRVSAVSFAWQTATMGAPAFAPYAPHDPAVTDKYGTFCPGCRNPVRPKIAETWRAEEVEES